MTGKTALLYIEGLGVKDVNNVLTRGVKCTGEIIDEE